MAPAAASSKTRSVPDPTQIELILTQIDTLPTLPVVAAKLLEITSSENTSAREVVQLLESDQSLAARVLSMASRAEYGRRAETIERAVAVLGFNDIRSLVLSIQVFETFSHRAEEYGSGVDLAGFWRHSLATACAAQLLAEYGYSGGEVPKKNRPRPEEMFVCGLLHDIGKVALNAVFPKTYERVVKAADATHRNIGDIEREIFGVDHAIAGRRLASHWKLPEMIGECIWLHHHLPESTPREINCAEHVRFVEFGDRIARHMRIGYSGNHSPEPSPQTLAGRFGIDVGIVERVMLELPESIEARAALIGLNELTSSAVYQEALAEANAELSRVNATLALSNRRLAERSACFEALRELTLHLGTESTHEQVCRAAVRGARHLAPQGGKVLLACSTRRSVLFIANGDASGKDIGIEVLSLELMGDLERFGSMPEAWWPVSLLPPALVERLSGAMTETPSWCWPIRHGDQFRGTIIACGETPGKTDESYKAFCHAVGAWLGGAETATMAQRLNEEIVETNRLLIESQTELTRMRSLSMIGSMAAGAAHEMNNPLAVISGRAQLLMTNDASEAVKRSASLISENAHRASAIVSELMEFAKPAEPMADDIDPTVLLGDIRREWLQKSDLGEKGISLCLSDGLPKVRVDGTQIRRLFDEVIRNALESLGAVADPHLSINCMGHIADDRIVIEVVDNGCGMTAEVLEEAMTPFFSHRTAGRGRGLGLSRAARYAEINGGRIRLSSEPGQGTTAWIELPIVSVG